MSERGGPPKTAALVPRCYAILGIALIESAASVEQNLTFGHHLIRNTNLLIPNPLRGWIVTAKENKTLEVQKQALKEQDRTLREAVVKIFSSATSRQHGQ